MPLKIPAPLRALALTGRPKLTAALGLALAAVLATGCTGPRTKRLSSANYERVPSDQEIQVFVPSAGGERLAIIESDAFSYVDETIKRKQLEQLQEKSRKLGGNAIEHVRILTKEVRGYTPDEAVPFTAWKQGRYELYFMRADATRRPEVEPESIDAARPAGGWVVESKDRPFPLRTSLSEIPMPGSELNDPAGASGVIRERSASGRTTLID